MGHFSHSCLLTGLPITGGSPVALIVMRLRDNIFIGGDNENLKQYGKSCWISNDNTQCKFEPVWYPIFGEYDEYGRVENIIEDDNTKALEEFYDLSIQEIVNIVCCGRKDDGFDDALKKIKVLKPMPKDWIEGERWFNYYQRTQNDPTPFGDGAYPQNRKNGVGEDIIKVWRDGKLVSGTKEEYDADMKLIHEQYARYKKWLEKNPEPNPEFNKNVQYQERYENLLSYSATWIHGDVYKKLTETSMLDEYDKLDLGTPQLLEKLGFVELEEKSSDERYNRQFKRGNLIVNSDGTWINVPNRGIYTYQDFKTYCNENGEDIDISGIEKQDRVEQFYDTIFPSMKSIGEKRDSRLGSKLIKEFEKLSEEDKKSKKGEKLLKDISDSIDMSAGFNRNVMMARYYLLNQSEYETTNEMLGTYFDYVKAGKLKDNIVRFWRFNYHMFSAGKYYDLIGVAPQDGDHEAVNRILKAALEVSDKIVEARKDW